MHQKSPQVVVIPPSEPGNNASLPADGIALNLLQVEFAATAGECATISAGEGVVYATGLWFPTLQAPNELIR